MFSKGSKLVYIRGSWRLQWTRRLCARRWRYESVDICTRRRGTSNGSKGWREERTDENEEAYDRSSVAFLDPHRYLYKEISYTPWLTLVKRVPTRKGSYKIHVLMRIFPIRKDISHQEIMSALHYYKIPKTLTNQETHNFTPALTL